MHMHAHDDDEQNSYYLDQLCTIGICGALAVVLILAYVNNALNEILNPKFHQPVLWGGLALLILVAIRAVAIWVASGKQTVTQSHSHAAGHEHVHDHEHTHECGHDHDHAHEHAHAGSTPEPHSHTHGACDHEHSHGEHDHEHGHEHSDAVAGDHGHEHGWAPWRYAVLLLPIVLYFLGIPAGRAYEDPAEEGGIPNLDFKEVEQAAVTPEGRQYWEGKEGRLMGKVSAKSSDGKALRLYRDKVTCCIADAYPIKIHIQSAQPVQQTERTWVKVVGKVTFHKVPDRDEWMTVMVADSVKSMDRPPANPNVY